MLVKLRVSGFITLDVPDYAVCSDENTSQVWINEFSNWVKDAQEELQSPTFDGIDAFIEDLDFLIED
jgi:hypothetical protein